MTFEENKTSLFEVGKTYKTRNGSDVKVVHKWDDGNIIYVYGNKNDYNVVKNDGKSLHGSGYDLMLPEPELEKVWINYFKQNSFGLKALKAFHIMPDGTLKAVKE